ncbi:hypothetical protein GYA27_00145 [candidate division WWE3 bacterium]|uniref:Uncharacterized protein n=1 Tax=candidate division WWE3 bacterium TaxID=2053526 RepID=A0A7X9DJZ5_UNCKA|nr:hypothetical protein [candidate division WWE3 bacterium]
MPLKKPNRVLLISVIILSLLMFAFVFLKPSFLDQLTGSSRSLPSKAKKQGYVIAKNTSETFAMEVPADWKVINYPESEGYTSLLTVQSSDYKVASNKEDAFGLLGSALISGAKLDISVIKSHEEYVPKPVQEITHQEIFESNDVTGTYYIYKDVGFAGAEFHEARFAKNGQVYFIKMTFNPKKYADGEKLFKYILSTLVIK